MVKNMVKLSSGVYIARLDRLMRECEEAIGVCDEHINNIINSSVDMECQSCNPSVNGNLGVSIKSSLDITQLENIDWVFDLKKISIEANQKAKRETIKSLENSLNTIIGHIQYMKDIDIDTEVLLVKKMVYDIYIRERTVELNLSGITLSDISGILKIPESTTGYYNRKRDSLYNDGRYKKIARHNDVMNYYFEGNSPEQIVEIFGREGYTRKLESIYEVLKCEKTWCVNMRKAIEIVLNNLNKELI